MELPATCDYWFHVNKSKNCLNMNNDEYRRYEEDSSLKYICPNCAVPTNHSTDDDTTKTASSDDAENPSDCDDRTWL